MFNLLLRKGSQEILFGTWFFVFEYHKHEDIKSHIHEWCGFFVLLDIMGYVLIIIFEDYC